MKGIYEKALTWVLAHKRVTLGSTIALFVVALGVFFTLDAVSFLPLMKDRSPSISVLYRVFHWKKAIKWDSGQKSY